MTTKGTHKYEAMTVHDDGGVAVRVLLWRDNAIIAEIPIEDWCELDAVKEWGGETDEEELERALREAEEPEPGPKPLWNMSMDELAALNNETTVGKD
jgi:hypothetical protein